MRALVITVFLLFSWFSFAEEAATSVKKETDYQLNLDTPTKSANTEANPIAKLAFALGIVGVLGAGAFYLFKKFAGIKNNPQTQIKVITQHFLGPKKSLAIIRVAGESMLIGVTDHNISMIKSLTLLDEEIPENTPQNFSKALKNAEFVATEGEDQDEFSIKGIKEVVNNKLKNMRSFE